MAVPLNLEGKKVGLLTYIKDAPVRFLPSGQKPRRAILKCDCGGTVDTLILHWIRGRITHCGCLGHKKHGEVNTGIYIAWRGMKTRCLKSRNHRASYYDKGIKVCEEWNLYLNFREWAIKNGWQPKMQVDRIDNNKGYYPENCRIVSPTINISNRSITVKIEYNGEIVPLSILITSKGMGWRDYNRILGRINRGWNAQKAVDTPARKGNYFTVERAKIKISKNTAI